MFSFIEYAHYLIADNTSCKLIINNIKISIFITIMKNFQNVNNESALYLLNCLICVNVEKNSPKMNEFEIELIVWILHRAAIMIGAVCRLSCLLSSQPLRSVPIIYIQTYPCFSYTRKYYRPTSICNKYVAFNRTVKLCSSDDAHAEAISKLPFDKSDVVWWRWWNPMTIWCCPFQQLPFEKSPHSMQWNVYFVLFF